MLYSSNILDYPFSVLRWLRLLNLSKETSLCFLFRITALLEPITSTQNTLEHFSSVYTSTHSKLREMSPACSHLENSKYALRKRKQKQAHILRSSV